MRINLIQQFLLLILSIVFISCANKPAGTLATGSKSELNSPDSATANDRVIGDSSLPKREFIEFQSVTLNGKIPLLTTTGALYGLLGKLDSIVVGNSDDNCGYYFLNNFKSVYIKGTQAEVLGDSVMVSTIMFKGPPELFLKTPLIKLSYSTTLSSLAEIFPNAVKDQTILDVDELGKAVTIRLELTEIPAEHLWLLFFQDNKLVRVDYYIPC